MKKFDRKRAVPLSVSTSVACTCDVRWSVAVVGVVTLFGPAAPVLAFAPRSATIFGVFKWAIPALGCSFLLAGAPPWTPMRTIAILMMVRSLHGVVRRGVLPFLTTSLACFRLLREWHRFVGVRRARALMVFPRSHCLKCGFLALSRGWRGRWSARSDL